MTDQFFKKVKSALQNDHSRKRKDGLGENNYWQLTYKKHETGIVKHLAFVQGGKKLK